MVLILTLSMIAMEHISSGFARQQHREQRKRCGAHGNLWPRFGRQAVDSGLKLLLIELVTQ